MIGLRRGDNRWVTASLTLTLNLTLTNYEEEEEDEDEKSVAVVAGWCDGDVPFGKRVYGGDGQRDARVQDGVVDAVASWL